MKTRPTLPADALAGLRTDSYSLSATISGTAVCGADASRVAIRLCVGAGTVIGSLETVTLGTQDGPRRINLAALTADMAVCDVDLWTAGHLLSGPLTVYSVVDDIPVTVITLSRTAPG